MSNWWIKFGCFVTGYNYGILKQCSEVAMKSVKRYTSAILIVCTLWAFVGYMFSNRYLHAGLIGSFLGSALMVFIIVQIERQIILSVHPGKYLLISRGLIAGMMAILGAIIIDQIIFKEDIELEQITLIENKIKKAMPGRSEILKSQIFEFDSIIRVKENERNALSTEVFKNPTIAIVSKTTTPVVLKTTNIDSNKNSKTTEAIRNTEVVSKSSIANPKLAMLAPLDLQINDLRNRKAEKDSLLLGLRPQLEKEIKEKVGFLDELNVMYALLSNSFIAFCVWFLWFLFLLGLELLVLIGKMSETKSDYERTILHQMEIQLKRLDLLAKSSDAV